MNKHILFSTFFVILTTTATALQAKSPTSDADINLLPPYCKAKYGRTTTADTKNWARKLGGRNFAHMHHYCAGLNYVNKANLNFDKSERNALLQRAIGQFNYVQERWPPDFVLSPEVCLRKGKALMRLNQVGSAIEQFNKAIKLNPKYAPAYAELSDYYSSHGEYEIAKQTLELGLKHKPNSKALKRRLGKLENSQ